MSAVIEIEISTGATPDVRSVRVLRSTGSSGGIGTLRLDVDGLVARRRELEMTVLASAVPARRVLSAGESEIQQIGAELFDRLFDGEIGTAYRTSHAIAIARRETLQMRLRLTDPDLAALPWEALYDRSTGAYLCRKDSLIRQIGAPDSIVPLQFQPPLRILGMISGPRNLPALDMTSERERLEKALGAQIAEGRVELVWLEDVSWDRLHITLLSESWHVLHFVGHSRYESDGDEGVLAFCGPDGRAEYVTASALADLLHEAEPIPRLVVLNSCASGATGVTELFSGTAAALVKSGIDAVVAMQFTISDPAAVAFSRGFYSALAHGRTIDEATRSGRIAILGLGRDTLEWVTPLLYVRGEDLRLFVVDETADVTPTRAQAADRPSSAPPTAPPTMDAAEEPADPGDSLQDPPRADSLEPPPTTRSVPAPGAEQERTTARRPSGAVKIALWSLLAVLLAGGAVAAVLLLVQVRQDAAEQTPSPSESATVSLVTTDVTVPSSQLWRITPVVCETGAPLSIRATGTVQHGPTVDRTSGPDGMEGEFLATNVVDDANHASLIGRIGEAGAPFLVGSALDTTCPADGTLYLGINDEGYGGNIGEFRATIEHEQ